VRLVDGKPQVLDGPYADSKEQFGGYFILDVADLDAAISWAAPLPAVGHGCRRGAAVVADSVKQGDEQARDAADAVARRSYGKLVAFLAARTRDVAQAEDALSEAFAAALADWPRERLSGEPGSVAADRGSPQDDRPVPAAPEQRDGNPAFAAPREGLDAAAAESRTAASRLMFACAHPAIEAGIRAPLILQVVLGWMRRPSPRRSSPLRRRWESGSSGPRTRSGRPASPFASRSAKSFPARLATVLDASTPPLPKVGPILAHGCRLAAISPRKLFFLAQMVSELLPEEPEALGLLALLLHAEARRRARRDADGEYVPLAEQDPKWWDAPMIAEAEALLRRAGALEPSAAISSKARCSRRHVDRCRTGYANWAEVVQLYDALFALAGSPVVAINRALAIAELHDANTALAAMPNADADADADARLAEYQPYWAARAELLAKAGSPAQARGAYEIAIGPRARSQRSAASCSGGSRRLILLVRNLL